MTKEEAAKQEAGLLNTPAPSDVEGPSLEEAEAGMAAMSEKYREGGNELYIGANGREHD